MTTPLTPDAAAPTSEHPAIRRAWGRSVLKLLRFRFDPSGAPSDRSCVLIAAPHTSNWDLIVMLACAYAADLSISWMAKHTIFRGPFGPFFRWLGGIPVDRRAPQGLVAQAVAAFERDPRMVLAVPPEGTRGRTEGWKTGFYWIAQGAQVPIVPTYLDWGARRAGFGRPIEPSGDLEADFERLAAFYEGHLGKYPERQGPVRPRPERRAEAPHRGAA